MNFQQSVEILEILGSSEDPVFIHGVNTTPWELYNNENIDIYTPAKDLAVDFYIEDGSLRKGTFFSMVIARMLPPH
jgi:hypothetical protein